MPEVTTSVGVAVPAVAAVLDADGDAPGVLDVSRRSEPQAQPATSVNVAQPASGRAVHVAWPKG